MNITYDPLEQMDEEYEEMNEEYIWVWTTIQTESEMQVTDLKQYVRISLYDCGNSQTSNPV